VTDQGIGSWPRRRARMEPDAVALVQDGRRLTYAGLAARAEALAAGLAGLGVRKGDRVAYMGPNDITTFESLFATARLGAIFVALNTRLAAPEIAYMLDDCDPAVLILSPASEATGRAAAALATAAPRVLGLPGDYEDLLAAHHGTPVPDREVGLDDSALILYTSGTTGQPKGAVLTHGNITWNTLAQFAHFSIARDTVCICSAPLFHVLALGQITLPALYVGATVVVLPRFDPGDFLATVARERATGFPLAPKMMQMLSEHPAWPATDLSSVRQVVYGGSHITERVAAEWLSRGIQVLQGYGMTEAAPGVLMALAHGAREHPTSPGVPHFFTEIALLTSDGRILGGPGQGELLVKGPHVFAGYWRRPDATREAFVSGWFRTGDIVRIDGDGWAHVVDRVKDMIISGGENIYPAQVEAAIAELAPVADCAVVGVPDPQWGEVGWAYIVPRPGHRLDETALREHLAQRLARYKIPKYFAFLEQLPRNAAGKVLRRPLREQARHGLSALPEIPPRTTAPQETR
jgi:fatty-acyl-CoA synthase